MHNEWFGYPLCSFTSFVFYHANCFYLIEYYNCLEWGDHLSFKFNILEQAIDQIKKAPTYNVERSYRLNEELRDSRNKGVAMRRELNEFNYTYSDNAGREYCFYTSMPFTEHLLNSTELLQNAETAIEYLRKNKQFRHHIKEVEELASLNNLYVSDYEIHKTVESLIKQINKK